jgi:hypothetical protein
VGQEYSRLAPTCVGTRWCLGGEEASWRLRVADAAETCPAGVYVVGSEADGSRRLLLLGVKPMSMPMRALAWSLGHMFARPQRAFPLQFGDDLGHHLL